MSSSLRPGRILLTVSALSHILGPFAADFNETHVLNPNWPPHARFHNGQTMTMGAALGLLMLRYIWRTSPSSTSKREDLLTAAIVGSLYFGSALTAVFYPGSAAVDPEFRHLSTSTFPQFWPFCGILMATWAGWGLERFGVGSGKGLKGM